MRFVIRDRVDDGTAQQAESVFFGVVDLFRGSFLLTRH
jgi:hypothetical protein